MGAFLLPANLLPAIYINYTKENFMKLGKNGRDFAKNVFDDAKMRKFLPKSTYDAIVVARNGGAELSERDHNVYAKALLKWAKKLGVTRYTHWFQPLNN